MSEETNDRLIELTDEETGETVVFEHLDTVELEGREYFVLTEYEEEEEAEESDVYVMQLVEDDDGEETLEIVEDEGIVSAVFDEFKKNFGDDFEFVE